MPSLSLVAVCMVQVAEEVEGQLQKYKTAVDEINSKTAGDGGGADGVMLDHDELLKRNTQNLMSAVSSLPELQVWSTVQQRGLEPWCVPPFPPNGSFHSCTTRLPATDATAHQHDVCGMFAAT